MSETLEKAAEKFRSNNPATRGGGNNSKIIKSFIAGAKWQQERSYSEEEVLDILKERDLHMILNLNGNNTLIHRDKWFKQFKKK